MKAIVVRVSIAFGLLAAVTAALYAWSYSDLVRGSARTVEDLAPYGDELRSLDVYGDSASCKDPNAGAQAYEGPGWYPRRSPAGDHVAIASSWGGPVSTAVLGLVMDRPFYHTVGVWDVRAARLTPVISIKEADPHSGIAHRYAWSKDGRALLVIGSGRLPDDYEAVVDLCLVYLPAANELYRLSRCPPYSERSVEQKPACWEVDDRPAR